MFDDFKDDFDVIGVSGAGVAVAVDGAGSREATVTGADGSKDATRSGADGSKEPPTQGTAKNRKARLSKNELYKVLSIRTGLPSTTVGEVIDDYRNYSKYMVEEFPQFCFLGMFCFRNQEVDSNDYVTFGKQIGDIARETGRPKPVVFSILTEYREFVKDNVAQGVPFTEYGLLMVKPPKKTSSFALRKSSQLGNHIRVSTVPWFRHLQEEGTA